MNTIILIVLLLWLIWGRIYTIFKAKEIDLTIFGNMNTEEAKIAKVITWWIGFIVITILLLINIWGALHVNTPLAILGCVFVIMATFWEHGVIYKKVNKEIEKKTEKFIFKRNPIGQIINLSIIAFDIYLVYMITSRILH